MCSWFFFFFFPFPSFVALPLAASAVFLIIKVFVFTGWMCGLDQPEPGPVAHDPWTAGCFQSPLGATVSLHVSLLPSLLSPCPLEWPDHTQWRRVACSQAMRWLAAVTLNLVFLFMQKEFLPAFLLHSHLRFPRNKTLLLISWAVFFLFPSCLCFRCHFLSSVQLVFYP